MSIFKNLTKQMKEHGYPIKRKIFDHSYDYAIITKVSDSWEYENTLYIEFTLNNLEKSTLEIKIFEDNIIHFFYYQKKDKLFFTDHLNKIKQIKLNYLNEKECFTILLNNNEKLVIYKKNGKITLIDQNDNVKLETNQDRGKSLDGYGSGYEMFGGYNNPPLGFRILKNYQLETFISFKKQNDENIYGLGEKFRPFLKTNFESVIWNTDPSCVNDNDLAYAGVPLIYSTKNWGLLVDNGTRTTWEIGSPTSTCISVLDHNENLSFWLFTGGSIKNCITSYTKLTGRISGVPDLAYGVWQNRLYYHNKKELLNEIEKAKKNNYPLDIITLDPKWLHNRMQKSCNFELNTQAFGDFKILTNNLKEQNIALCLWINPYIQMDNSSTFLFLKENDYLVKDENNQLAHPLSGCETYQERNCLLNFFNQKAFVWYKEQIKNLFKLGVRFVKPDYGDGLPYNAYFSKYQKNGSQMRQWYEYLYLKAAYEASCEYFGDGKALIFSRPGFIGTQKFVGKWGGDSYSSFEEFKIQLHASLSLALTGNIMWGSDIVGFVGPKPSFDLFKKWTAFGFLCTLSRYHRVGVAEPWNYGKKELEIATKYANLKRQLLPYFKIFEYEAIKNGIPIMRPMVLENQNDKISQLIGDQYYLGDNLLVCPILIENIDFYQIYLPNGEWYLFEDKKTVYKGGIHTLSCKNKEIFIFVKSGGVIPMIKEEKFKLDKLEKETLILNIYGKLDNINYHFFLNNKKCTISYKNNKWNNDVFLKVEII